MEVVSALLLIFAATHGSATDSVRSEDSLHSWIIVRMLLRTFFNPEHLIGNITAHLKGK
jgi:hypothetical protein